MLPLLLALPRGHTIGGPCPNQAVRRPPTRQCASMSGRLAEGESLDPRAKRCWSKRVRLNYEHPPDNAVASLLLSTLTNLRRHTTGQSIAESPRASPQPLGSDRLEISGANALHFALRGVPKSGSPSFFSQCGRDPSGVSLQGAARQSTSQSARKVSRRLEAFVHFRRLAQFHQKLPKALPRLGLSREEQR